VISRARHFLSLPAPDKRAYLLLTWWLIVIRAMFKLMDFQQITTFVSRRRVQKRKTPTLSLARLSQIIQNAGTRLPSTCLSRSLAGALVLARFGYRSAVQIGVSTDQDFHAHAWLESDGASITEPDVPPSRWKPLTRLTINS
jgi:Transglutaminase-like superfamily